MILEWLVLRSNPAMKQNLMSFLVLLQAFNIEQTKM